ncbi:MAG: hypothetical protein ABI413_08130, partial [Ktedonobacteraceae bacterium]
MSFHARREVLHQLAPQYQHASSAHKSTLLDEYTTLTGYNRKYAMWLLNHAQEDQQATSSATARTCNRRCSWPGMRP